MLVYFLLLPMILSGCSIKSTQLEDVIVAINGVDIPKGEFMLYFYESQKNFVSKGGTDIWETDFSGRSAETVAKERALDALKIVEISYQQAKKAQLTLTNQEMEAAEKNAEDTWNGMGEETQENFGISYEDVKHVMEKKALYQKFYDQMTKNFAVSESDFNLYYEQNREETKKALTKIKIEGVFSESEVESNVIFAEVSQGKSLESVAKEKGASIVQEEISYLEIEDYLDPQTPLEIGSVDQVLSSEDDFIVIQIVDVRIPEEDVIRTQSKKDYEKTKKQELYQSEYKKWEENAKIELNGSLWDNIHRIDVGGEV